MTQKSAELYTAVLKKVHDLLSDFAHNQVFAEFDCSSTCECLNVPPLSVLVSRFWFLYFQAVIKGMRKIDRIDAYTEMKRRCQPWFAV